MERSVDIGLATIPILVLNWNGWEDTLRCLHSLAADDEIANVWLIDNASDEDRAAEAADILPELRQLRWTENHGFAGGYNRALQVAMDEGCPFMFLLNNDCRVQPGFLSAAVLAATGDERIGAVGSRIQYEDAGHSLMFDGEFYQPGEKMAGGDARVKRVEHVCGAGMLIRTAALRDVGLFDDRHFCYGEETEWCLRARKGGWEVIVANESVVYHRAKGSDQSQNAAYYQARNYFLLLRQIYPAWRARWKAFDYGMEKAQLAFEEGAEERRVAIFSGVFDGMRGRFGKRSNIGQLGLFETVLRRVWLGGKAIEKFLQKFGGRLLRLTGRVSTEGKAKV